MVLCSFHSRQELLQKDVDKPDSRNCSTLGKDVHQLAREDPIQRSCASAEPSPTPSRGVVPVRSPHQPHPSSCPLPKDHVFQWEGLGRSHSSRLLRRRYLTRQHQQKTPVPAEQPKCWADKTLQACWFCFFLFFFSSQKLFHALMAIFKNDIGVTTYVSVS